MARPHRTSVRAQLVAQVGAAIRSGELAPGERLPSSRRLAAHLGIHRHTVSNAYVALGRLGLVRRRPGSG
ncbi:MAG: GntR family transcriptional regulator, partial [Gemmatimonadota bacterium]